LEKNLSYKMTEDDTFNRLRRSPIEDIIAIINQNNMKRHGSNQERFDSNLNLLRVHGWNSVEYEKEKNEYFRQWREENKSV
jgi:hypothetical protein